MAGYIFNLDSVDSLRLYADHGVYATKLPEPNGRWKIPQEGTFADYSTMKPGDNVYFFIKRKIYGIGELVEINGDCKFSNFEMASAPNAYDYQDLRDDLLWDEGEHSVNQRWLCTFRPSPYFFLNGIDMDDALASNPSAFKMLRALWKLSFIKFDNVENQAFKDVILKYNQDALSNPQEDVNIFNLDTPNTHERIQEKLHANNYSLNLQPLLSTCADGDYLRHEMAIEAGLLYQIAINDPDTKRVFGDWDYLSHQVVASPFKPIDYMDKMDLFGYRYIPNYAPTISNYLVGEIKKDQADTDSIDQLLKYVDWIKEEYSFGDYGMINAFLIAYDFDETVIDHARHVGNRTYILGRRPATSCEWRNIQLIKYRYDNNHNKLIFERVFP